LYTRLLFHIDFENWETQKCNPKYIFYSGYIKRNSGKNSLTTTIDNFNDCIIKYNELKDNNFSKTLDMNLAEKTRLAEQIVNNHNKISAQKAFQIQKELESKKNDYNDRLDSISATNPRKHLMDEINHLKTLFQELKEYSHSYLTYAMMNFVMKLKLAEKQSPSSLDEEIDTSGVENVTHCSDLNNKKTECDETEHCSYNTTDNVCTTKTRKEFYTEQANRINSMIKTYFGNNKL